MLYSFKLLVSVGIFLKGWKQIEFSLEQREGADG